ncbi:MAG TPA: SRPBCC family protein [Actinomycetospora sp.]|nr:SRPBCC family protein [Actinomycetospora sp.]
MILDNHLAVPADPDAVFALLNDVERVAGCLPGATLEGRDGEAYRGRVKVKVGPISAAYAGTLRFTEVVPEQRTLRLSARASDAHGAGDAEADVVLSVAEADGGSTLDLHTDLLVRGKIAQFGKGAITTVSSRLLDQFARNLAGELSSPAEANGSGTSGASVGATLADSPQHADRARKSPSSPAPAPADEPLDGLAMLLPAGTGRYAALAAVAGLGLFQGYLLGRLRGQTMLIEELRRHGRR